MKLFDNISCPVGNGGGTCKNLEQVKKLLKTDISIIEIGSITLEERPGNDGITFWDGNNFTLNSLGLPNAGIKKAELKKMIGVIHEAEKKCIVNVVGFNEEEYPVMTQFAFQYGADAVVLNYGCPNVFIGGEVQKSILTYNFSGVKTTTIKTLAKNTKEARQGRIGVKLSPITDPYYIASIADFLNHLMMLPQQNIGHVGFITTMNTIPNCFYDYENKPVISPGGGLSGMGGKAVFPIALGQIIQFRKLLRKEIKIIGIGGVTTGADVDKMIRSGANFVQVASILYATDNVSIINSIGAEYLMLTE